jgi:hypothetical protein
MITSLYYIFTPTIALLDAMKVAEETYLSQVSVWITKEHDRTGPEQTQAQIESAFWTIFLAKLVGEDPEPVLLRELREKCLRLGLSGCWTIVCTRTGGPAAELVEEAIDAELFVRQYVQISESGEGIQER